VSDDFDASDPSEMARVDLAAALHTHLAATEELPIDPTANRWLGEAQAAAADVADGSAPDAVVTKRARQVVRLLESAGDLDNDEAVRHVDAALAVARELVDRGEN
jgi:ABC-type cobalamin transport system ATPase subunit